MFVFIVPSIKSACFIDYVLQYVSILCSLIVGNCHFKVCGDRANVVYFEMRNKLTFDTKKILVAHNK